MATVHTIGNFTIDDIVHWPSGQTRMGQPGGNVLFSALGARIWLDSVVMVARLANDYPRQLLEDIEARGIVLALYPVDLPILHDWALYEAGGARQFVNHLNSCTNDGMTIRPEEIPAEQLQGGAYHIAPVPTSLQAALVKKLKHPGRLISLDPLESWIAGKEAQCYDVLKQVDFFMPSALEAELLYGSNDFEAAARAFGSLGPHAIVIKLGAQGSLVYEARHGRLTHVPIFPTRVRDLTGAGDAYCGGFLAGYLITQDALSAAQHGTVSASYVVEAVGALATRQPGALEVRERLTVVVERTRRPQ